MNVEVPPIDALHQHGVHVLEELVLGDVHLQQRHAEIMGEALGHGTILTRQAVAGRSKSKLTATAPGKCAAG